MNIFQNIEVKKTILITIGAVILSFLVGLFTIKFGIVSFFISTAAVGGIIFLLAVIKDPRISFIFYMLFCFSLSGIMKNNPQLPLGPFMEVLLGLTWVSIISTES